MLKKFDPPMWGLVISSKPSSLTLEDCGLQSFFSYLQDEYVNAGQFAVPHCRLPDVHRCPASQHETLELLVFAV